MPPIRFITCDDTQIQFQDKTGVTKTLLFSAVPPINNTIAKVEDFINKYLDSGQYLWLPNAGFMATITWLEAGTDETQDLTPFLSTSTLGTGSVSSDSSQSRTGNRSLNCSSGTSSKLS